MKLLLLSIHTFKLACKYTSFWRDTEIYWLFFDFFNAKITYKSHSYKPHPQNTYVIIRQSLQAPAHANQSQNLLFCVPKVIVLACKTYCFGT